MTESIFKKRTSIEQVEEGKVLAPKFNDDGLIPCITSDYLTGEILMHSYMNEESFIKTLKNKEAHYWSRSRQVLWKKGESSGMLHVVKEIWIDDDQDSILLKVEVKGLGGSCHVGYRSCFYRSIQVDEDNSVKLKFEEENKLFNPKTLYGDAENPTKI